MPERSAFRQIVVEMTNGGIAERCAEFTYYADNKRLVGFVVRIPTSGYC